MLRVNAADPTRFINKQRRALKVPTQNNEANIQQVMYANWRYKGVNIMLWILASHEASLFMHRLLNQCVCDRGSESPCRGTGQTLPVIGSDEECDGVWWCSSAGWHGNVGTRRHAERGSHRLDDDLNLNPR